MAIALCLAMIMPAFASEDTGEISVIDGVIEALSGIEAVKNEMGLGEVDFALLNIGNIVYMYEYTSSGLEEFRSAYPLFFGGELVAFAVKLSDEIYQITTQLASCLADLGADTVAIVYDRIGCYAYNGKEFELLIESTIDVPGRAIISDGEIPMLETLELTDLTYSSELNYKNECTNARMSAYVTCPISYVTQNPNTYLCWAAVTASIVNYVNGTSLTATDVATEKFGSALDQSMYDGDVADLMNDSYNLGYSFQTAVPDVGVMHTNIYNGYPIYGSFTWERESRTTTSGRHATTIYAVHLYSQYIMVMDPEVGFITCSYAYEDSSESSGIVLNTFAKMVDLCLHLTGPSVSTGLKAVN